MPSLINDSIVPPDDLIDIASPFMVPVFFNVFTLAFICIPSFLPSIVPVLLKFSILVPLDIFTPAPCLLLIVPLLTKLDILALPK